MMVMVVMVVTILMMVMVVMNPGLPISAKIYKYHSCCTLFIKLLLLRANSQYCFFQRLIAICHITVRHKLILKLRFADHTNVASKKLFFGGQKQHFAIICPSNFSLLLLAPTGTLVAMMMLYYTSSTLLSILSIFMPIYIFLVMLTFSG